MNNENFDHEIPVIDALDGENRPCQVVLCKDAFDLMAYCVAAEIDFNKTGFVRLRGLDSGGVSILMQQALTAVKYDDKLHIVVNHDSGWSQVGGTYGPLPEPAGD